MRIEPWPPRAPLGFAHRGARDERQDNTLAAFERALELGATALESDAWLTADRQVVLDHDGVVGPLWRRQLISTVTAGDLPTHIPRLSELYTTCGTSFELSLDVKDPRTVPEVLSVAARWGALASLWLCSSDIDQLDVWRGQSEKVHLVISTRRSRLGARGVGDLARRGVDAVNLQEREWDQGFVNLVHQAKLLAFGWDAQSDRQLDRLLGLGVDGVYCDHVARMCEAVARYHRGPHVR